jgi:hypothetical protein
VTSFRKRGFQNNNPVRLNARAIVNIFSTAFTVNSVVGSVRMKRNGPNTAIFLSQNNKNIPFYILVSMFHL